MTEILPIQKQYKPWQITRENAKEMSAKANAAKAARKLLPKEPVVELEPETEQSVDKYVQLNLSRTRAQLDRLFELMAEESDPQKLDRLASAIARLAEQERQLSGRPLPGSLRPRQEKPRKPSQIEPEL